MTETEFKKAVAATRLRPGSRTVAACRLVLVDGLTAYAAARKIGITAGAISAGLRALRRPRCAACGAALSRNMKKAGAS